MMKNGFFLVLFFLYLVQISFADLESYSKLSEQDWPWWRGAYRNGKALEGQQPPIKWSEDKNIKWKAKVPGRGHASPIVVSNYVVLATADEEKQTQSVVAYDRSSGELLWETMVHQGNFSAKIHSKNTHASQTVASDGEQCYVTFDNDGSIFASALNLKSGKLIWRKEVGVFSPQKYEFGYGSSPLIYENKFIVVAESDSSSQIVALDLKSGKQLWKTPRELNLNWASPTIAMLNGKPQLLLSGSGKITSYDPKTGKELWSEEGSATATCGTCVWDNGLVFASGGYPERETVAVKAGGGVVWKSRVKVYEPSMLAHNGYLYAIDDSGSGTCFRSKDGEVMWKNRMVRGLSASPILAGDYIYVAGLKGKTVVFKATPSKFELVAENQLGADNYSTPAFCHNQIFIRVGEGYKSSRSEWLYCIGN